MTVTPYDRGSYFVSSEHMESPYLVDLEQNNGFGWCDCKDFQIRSQPRLNKNKVALPCKHIRAARKYHNEIGVP